jgi:uncharacterized RDD family membrane protein YckC
MPLKKAMKPRFKLDVDQEVSRDSELIELERLDASEQMFAASLEPANARPTFTVSRDEVEDKSGEMIPVAEDRDPSEWLGKPQGEQKADESRASLQDDLNAWKQEVTARVSRYRSRRPRAPRYPSLLLKFENVAEEPIADESQPMSVNLNAVAAEMAPCQTSILPHLEPVGRILEFPRSTMSVPLLLDELAEPVPSLPRILEVPETPPPPPALGGILIECEEEQEPTRRPGFEIPLHAASMGRRIFASAIDSAVILAVLTGFGYIFLRLTRQIPAPLQAVAMLATVGSLLWATYQYAFLVYTGSTPGLILTRLHVSCFDGSGVSRKARQLRVLASFLSAASLGLGYFWSFLDEDQLCWHDRITTTYIAPKPANTETSK